MGNAVLIELLDGFRVRLPDRVVTHFRTQKASCLLAYLAYFRERLHPREVLIETSGRMLVRKQGATT